MYMVMDMARRICRYRLLSAAIACLLAFSTGAFAKAKADRTQFGHDISIGPSEEVGDVTCIGCSIRTRGQIFGDATTVGGSIFIEGQGQVAGDVTAVAGDARLGNEVKVAGGELRQDPHASVSGDVTNVGGRGWILPILVAPFAILGLLVALVVWLIQRARRPAIPPVPA